MFFLVGSSPVKFPGGIFLGVVKIQRLAEAEKYDTDKPLPGFAQSRQMVASKPMGRERGGRPNDCFPRSGLFICLTMSALQELRLTVSYRRAL